MSQTPGVTDTAAAIARVRAEEASLPAERRLFTDPYAPLFFGGAAAADVTDKLLSVPFFREQVRLRTRFIDDFVREGIASGSRQLVILGAGFDCRALRLAEIRESRTLVFEIDFPAQLAFKWSALEAAGTALPDFVRTVGVDLGAPAWESEVRAHLVAGGFDRDRSALFLLEGVISYLESAEIARTLRWMASAAAVGSRAIFNFTVGRLDPERLSDQAKAAGFAEVADYRLDEIFVRFLPGDPPAGGELFHIAVARS